MKTIKTLNCKYCNTTFSVSQSEFNRNNTKYCSRICSSSSKNGTTKTTPNKNCSFCGKAFYLAHSKQYKSKSGLHFCSRKCKDQAQRLENGFTEIHPTHYGRGDGIHHYRDLAFRTFPHECNSCSYSKIPEVLVVHHKDQNRSNNKLENLVILCPTCHGEEHFNNRG